MTSVKNGTDDKDTVYTGKIVQITNVSPGATIEQMATLFGFLGTVTDIRLYPSDEFTPVSVKICYIKYENSEQCGVAQHLTNTVFIDKPLIVVPIDRDEPPEEEECSHLLQTVNAYAAMAVTGYLPAVFPVKENESAIPGLPPPPIITSSTDPVEMEEIRRTIFVENIKDSTKSEQLMAFFSGVGEVKYLRLCKGPTGKYAFVEFSNVESVPLALQYDSVIFGGRHLKVVHAKSAISKPESVRIASGRTPVRKYVESVRKPSMDRFTSRSPSRRRSRTRSPVRRHSRTRSPSKSSRKKRSRTGSPRRRRSRTRSPPRRRSRSRTKSPVKRKSRSRSRSPKRRRSRSRSKDRKISRPRSTSRSPRRKSRQEAKQRKSRSRSPSRRRSRKSLSRSPDRSSKKKKKDKDREKEKSSKKDAEDTTKELDNLLTKIHNYEEEQKKVQSGDDKKKKKESL